MLVEVGYTERRSFRRTKYAVGKAGFSSAVVFLEIAVITFASLASGILYHLAAYGVVGPVIDFVHYGLLTGACFILPFAYRGQYVVEAYLDRSRCFAKVLAAWTYAILTMTLIGFLANITDSASRGWLLVFYAVGLGALAVLNVSLHEWVTRAVKSGLVAPRRLLLVGDAERLAQFVARVSNEGLGIEIASAMCLPAPEDLEQISEAEFRNNMNEAILRGREQAVSDVVVLLDPRHDKALRRVTEGLMELPAAIHLGGWSIIDSFPGLRADRIGQLKTLTLVRSPLNVFEDGAKRLFDFILALVALVLVSPVLLLAVIALKLDSPGPAFFRQRRRGFNQQEFRIWKLRTMTTLDDGDKVVQATAGDARITRIGAFLRRTNIDELPQLLNVLQGEMSLVGPRPHAVAHDRRYERTIDRYARRLNVKPGITGWAQVNGFRGPTLADEAMRDRLRYDLYYIDHWSIAFDLLILLMTVVSPRAYRNAY
ncbi:MAG: exopolysaccharide biosynthesis polyprenyl glycosylphosphotransferase [Alphaproteobacteria bacterium]|nr:exopolysaccharide biosynthesis polyprenyl glycosylphosphotransferase [Alphaproteobacteria bacterium]